MPTQNTSSLDQILASLANVATELQQAQQAALQTSSVTGAVVTKSQDKTVHGVRIFSGAVAITDSSTSADAAATTAYVQSNNRQAASTAKTNALAAKSAVQAVSLTQARNAVINATSAMLAAEATVEELAGTGSSTVVSETTITGSTNIVAEQSATFVCMASSALNNGTIAYFEVTLDTVASYSIAAFDNSATVTVTVPSNYVSGLIAS